MAAVDYFLKIDGIPGDSKDHKHKDEIELLNFSWGEAQTGTPGTGGGGGAGKVQMQDFHFTMKVSKASPKLFLACASGQHIKTATFVARNATKDQQEFLKIRFSDLLISSFQDAGTDDFLPMDQVAFNFSKIELEFHPQKPDGSLAPAIKAGWDIKKNVKI